MNQLAAYRDSRGLSNAQVADELSALLGRRISEQGVKLWASRGAPPKGWANALRLAAEPAATPEPEWEPEPVYDTGDTPPLRDDPGPPRAPSGTTFHGPAVTGSGEYGFVRDRIAKAYGALGAGASMVTGNQGYASVANEYSGDLADAWIAAAQTNQNVARIVAFMESGGPVGELVVAHVILTLGFVYVSGRGPDLDFLYAGKFGPHRAAAVHAAAAEGAEWGDGAGANGQTDPMAYAATAPGP